MTSENCAPLKKTPTDPKGIIFDIQHYSIHDGPGIRTTVFLKGCPLNCLWCQNPESQSFAPVLFYYSDKCSGCGICQEQCPQNAIHIQKIVSSTNRKRCDNCGQCASVCPNNARVILGQELTVAEVFKEVEKDAVFYQNSQGGVTISGGEPAAQPGFVHCLSKLCHAAGFHVTMETCGSAPFKTIRHIMRYVDLVLYDFKHMDDRLHKKATGSGNQRILENAKRIYHELKKDMHARVPIIPGYNDSKQNIATLANFITTQLGSDVEVHLLPYHNLGQNKYRYLEASYPLDHINLPDDEKMQDLLTILDNAGLKARVGG